MRILITGANGQLGHDLIAEFSRRGIDTIPADINEMDITDKESVIAFITAQKPSAIIHCAAWTAVDAAEENREACLRVNAEGTRNISEAAAAINARLIYISTDYVFNGEGVLPWNPDTSTPAPLNVYGESKYRGELAVKAKCRDYLIIRISWVFGSNGRNFIKTMLNLGLTHKQIRVVDDQIGSPTYTHDLSMLIADMTPKEVNGIFHATNSGYCSWYELAKEIFRQAVASGHKEYENVEVLPVHSSEYPAKAKRPMNSRMDCSKLKTAGFNLLPDWQDAVGRFLKEIEY